VRPPLRGDRGLHHGDDCSRRSCFSETTVYRWKRQYGEMGVSELRELRQLRDENRKLKQVVADLTLDKTILQESLRNKW
jgi:putative transposase